MKVFYRFLKFLAILVIVITTTLFLASFVMQDTVAGIILRSLNKNISTKYEFKSVRLSFLKRFPNASLDLKNVFVHSSPGFDKTCFTGINTDTLLYAGSATVEFSLADVIRGIYDIDRIGVKGGRLNLYTDTAGAVNYEISVEGDTDVTTNFILNLERINVSEVKATYNDLETKLLIKGFVDNGRLKSRITGKDIDFTAEGEFRIDLFRLNNFTVAKSIEAESDLRLFSSDKGILFRRSTLKLDDYLFNLSGSISSDDVYDLTISGEQIDISAIKNYLPDKHQTRIAGYNPSGVLNIKGIVKGPSTPVINPGIQVDFEVENGNVTYGTSAVTIKDLSFDGKFTNGRRMSAETSSLSITGFRGTLGSSQYTGSLVLSDFNALYGKLDLKGRVLPAEIKEFFNLQDVSTASGSIDLDLKMQGMIPNKEKYYLSDLFSLDPDADLKFNSFSLGIRKDSLLVNDVAGNILVSDTVIARDVKLTFRAQKFILNGLFINFPGWVSGERVVLRGSADISCDKLMPEILFHESADSASENETGYHFPRDVIMDLKIKTQKLIYKTFEAENITGEFSYKPKLLNFKSLNFNSMEGTISGNGFLVQNADKSFMGRGNFILDKIDVNKAFISFRNFDQDFIKAENLSGTVSGSLSLLLPMDSLLNPNFKSITAEGKFVFTDGALIDFKPVQELSSFIHISELKDIHFDRLENDFFIRNNFIYLPMMDVKSSAADLTVNGKHSWDNDYEYHVRILLSEALSKKIGKPKPNTTEFGAVQDDGLGRTSLLLKIEGNDEDVKVGYDLKAAGNQVKSEIKSERQNLKTILNQEFGWYKNDTAVNSTTTTKPKRFRITWEETDTTKIE
jgi:hypothetical protein